MTFEILALSDLQTSRTPAVDVLERVVATSPWSILTSIFSNLSYN